MCTYQQQNKNNNIEITQSYDEILPSFNQEE